MIQASKIQKGNFQSLKIFHTLPGGREIQNEQLSFREGLQILNRIRIKNSENKLHLNLV
jgi:hypothetical protein